jgi:hypothetical protein
VRSTAGPGGKGRGERGGGPLGRTGPRAATGRPPGAATALSRQLPADTAHMAGHGRPIAPASQTRCP